MGASPHHIGNKTWGCSLTRKNETRGTGKEQPADTTCFLDAGFRCGFESHHPPPFFNNLVGRGIPKPWIGSTPKSGRFLVRMVHRENYALLWVPSPTNSFVSPGCNALWGGGIQSVSDRLKSGNATPIDCGNPLIILWMLTDPHYQMAKASLRATYPLGGKVVVHG